MICVRQESGIQNKRKKTATMRSAAVPLLAVLMASAKPAMSSCVDPLGIVPGGGEGLIDLDFLLTPDNDLSSPLPLSILNVREKRMQR